MSATSDELAAAKAARLAILGGRLQSYQTVIGGAAVYLKLSELTDLITRLEGQVAIEGLTGAGGPSRIEVGLGSIDYAR